MTNLMLVTLAYALFLSPQGGGSRTGTLIGQAIAQQSIAEFFSDVWIWAGGPYGGP